MTRPHRAVRTDANQSSIIADLEHLGAYVWRLSDLGGEVLDLICFWRGLAIPVEIKTPGEREELTDKEREGIRRLALVGIEAVVATCAEDVVAAFEELLFGDIGKGER